MVIAGAGIGGLVAALALQQRGFEVALYEQARDLRGVGAGVQISPNGTRVLYSLGLAVPIRAVAAEPAGKEVWRGDNYRRDQDYGVGLLNARKQRG
jgi:salicylate hydroxylase